MILQIKIEEAQNKFAIVSIVSFQIEVICIFQKEEFTSLFLKILSIQTVFRYHKPSKRLLLQDYVQWPASRTQFQPS